jgi:hypothetical protein
MLAAADALPVADQAGKGRLRGQALRVTERVITDWGRRFHWLLPEHFTADWEPLPEYNRDRPADPFRPYGVTVGHLSPDITFILDIRPEQGLARAAERRGGNAPDRFESQELMLHERIRRAFLDIAEEEPDRCVVIDASQPEAMWPRCVRSC